MSINNKNETYINKKNIISFSKRYKTLDYIIKRKKGEVFNFYFFKVKCKDTYEAFKPNGEKISSPFRFTKLKNIVEYLGYYFSSENIKLENVDEYTTHMFLTPKLKFELKDRFYSKYFNNDKEMDEYIKKLDINMDDFLW